VLRPVCYNLQRVTKLSVESTYTKKANEVTAPRAGEVTVFAGSVSSASQNLALCGPLTVNMANADVLPSNIAGSATSASACLDKYVEFYADGVDFGLTWGPSNASVTGNNAPNLSVTGVNTTGGNGACCLRIPAGTTRSFYIHTSTLWVGYVASAGQGFLRIMPTSR
jgi:hypothetical protein